MQVNAIQLLRMEAADGYYPIVASINLSKSSIAELTSEQQASTELL